MMRSRTDIANSGLLAMVGLFQRKAVDRESFLKSIVPMTTEYGYDDLFIEIATNCVYENLLSCPDPALTSTDVLLIMDMLRHKILMTIWGKSNACYTEMLSTLIQKLRLHEAPFVDPERCTAMLYAYIDFIRGTDLVFTLNHPLCKKKDVIVFAPSNAPDEAKAMLTRRSKMLRDALSDDTINPSVHSPLWCFVRSEMSPHRKGIGDDGSNQSVFADTHQVNQRQKVSGTDDAIKLKEDGVVGVQKKDWFAIMLVVIALMVTINIAITTQCI